MNNLEEYNLNKKAEYNNRMFKKGLLYDSEKNIYYNQFGVYLWSVPIYKMTLENSYLEKISKENMQQLGLMINQDVSMFLSDYESLLEKIEQGHQLFLVNQKCENTSPYYDVYSKNYMNVLTKQKTLTK